MSKRMDRPLLIRRRKELHFLLLPILTLVILLWTPAKCASIDTIQDIGHNRHKFIKINNIDNNVHKLITKDVTLYGNPTGLFNGTANKNIGQIPTLHNLTLESNSKWNSSLSSGLDIVKFLSSMSNNCANAHNMVKCFGYTVFRFISIILQSTDSYENTENVRNSETRNNKIFALRPEGNFTLLQQEIIKRIRNSILSVNLNELENDVKETARAGLSWFKPEDGGKSSFLTGFGLGFLAFGLKKLLLPIFIGAQIVKSVMIAMFLPSILGGLGKLVGKGVSTFASASGSSGPSNTNVDDFEFKDNMGLDSGDSAAAASKYSSSFTYPETYGSLAYDNGLSAGTLPATALYVPGTSTGLGSINRFQESATANAKISYASLPTGAQHHYGSYYTRHQQPNKKQDYKVFHNIPSSSLLLTNYDPFYSPLLSRLDSVFKQLGYETETCRERLVCAMYNNPAKFAPYSNLVSAQLSRELNELRKPSTDNPEILRFFRYMKAAKDGQDGMDCIQLHPGCSSSSAPTSVQPPMIKTYHDINKLVQARRLGKSIGVETKTNHSPET